MQIGVKMEIVREQYLKRIRPFYESELIKVLIGIRRSGKSVILSQIMEELKESGHLEENIIYINFEDLDYSFIVDEMDLHKYIKDRISKEQKFYLFFDEIQMVQNFEKAINSFRAVYDVSIFITGSNGKLLSGELATLLSGRYVSFKISPFSFKEVCTLLQLTEKEQIENAFQDYLIWGGMPQRFKMNSETEIRVFLNDLYSSIVLKDIVLRSNIKNVDILNRIVEYLILNPSQIFSAKSVSNYFESIDRKVSTETLYSYLEQITASLIINKAVRYDIRGKKILTRMDKYYLTDLGLGKIRNTGMKTEYGALLENVIYNELLVRGYEVYVGKITNGEIDFIAIKDGKKEYYQVAYQLATDEVVNREFGSYMDVPDNFPKYVISMDKWDFSQDGIIHKNAIDFLLEE